MTKPILRECPHCGKILPPSHRQPRAQKSKIERDPDSWTPLVERYRLQHPEVTLTAIGIAEGIGVAPTRAHVVRIGRVLRALGYVKCRKLPRDIYLRPEDVPPPTVLTAAPPRPRQPDPFEPPLAAWLSAPAQARALTLDEAVAALGADHADHGQLCRIGRLLLDLGRRRTRRRVEGRRTFFYEPSVWTAPARSAS